MTSDRKPSAKSRIPLYATVERCKPGNPRSSINYRHKGKLVASSFVPDWHREFDALFLEWEQIDSATRMAKIKEQILVEGKETSIVGALHDWIDKKIMDQIRIRRKHYRLA